MTRAEIKDASRRLRASVSAILFKFDPAEMNFGVNSDEYESVAETIIARLDYCRSEPDVLKLVESELLEWFDDETAASPNVAAIAGEIWKLIEPESYGPC
jgi:hypothetical protein